MRSVYEFFNELKNIYSITIVEKIFRIFQTYQQTFQKTEILSFFISKKKPLTNVKKWTRKIEIKFGNIKLKFKKKKKKKKQRVIFSYNMREQKSIIFPFSFFFIFHPKLLNQWKSERCSWKAIMLLLDTNPTFHITMHTKNHFSPFIFFFLFFPFILTGKRIDLCVD